MPRADYPYQMLFLTRREQIVVAFILVSLFAGAGIRHFRMSARLPSSANAAAPARLSP